MEVIEVEFTLLDLNNDTIPPVNAFTAAVLVSISFSKFNDTPCTRNNKNNNYIIIK